MRSKEKITLSRLRLEDWWPIQRISINREALTPKMKRLFTFNRTPQPPHQHLRNALFRKATVRMQVVATKLLAQATIPAMLS